MTMRWSAAVLASLVGIVGAGCGEKAPAVADDRLVDVVRVVAGSARSDIAYAGEVRPRYETSLGFRVAGKVVARNVEIGTVVRKGDVLARLDPEDQRLNARSAESQLVAARSDYMQSKAEFERYADLFQKKFVSALEFERRENGYRAAEARMEQAQAQLEVTRNQARYTELLADHAGVITAMLVEAGQVVAAGQTVMKLARTDEREIAINIPENRLSELGTTRDIAISLWADPAKTYRGRVREISPAADPATRTYGVKISVLDADAAVRLGMTANVFLNDVQPTHAITLPAAAVFEDGGNPAVWTVDTATGALRLVPVKLAKYVEDKAVVLSGLHPGDVVVRAGVQKLIAGEKVRVREEALAGAMK